jgi:hypothetical protein
MKTDVEYADEARAITKEWIEERILKQEQEKRAGKTPDKKTVVINAELQTYYKQFEKIIADLKTQK